MKLIKQNNKQLVFQLNDYNLLTVTETRKGISYQLHSLEQFYTESDRIALAQIYSKRKKTNEHMRKFVSLIRKRHKSNTPVLSQLFFDNNCSAKDDIIVTQSEREIQKRFTSLIQ